MIYGRYAETLGGSGMKSRMVSFYIDLDALPPLMAAVEDLVIPRYEAMPHFLGLTLIKRDVLERAEVIVTSFWDDDLDESESQAKRFFDAINQLTGRNPSRRTYDTLYAKLRDPPGSPQPAPDQPRPQSP
jgi:hypothetical protein